MPDTAPVPSPRSAGSEGLWVTLGLAVMLLLPFGAMGLLVPAVVAMGMWGEALHVTAVLAAGALFLLAPPPGQGIRPRLWPALRWGGGAALLAGLPLAILALAQDGWVDRHRFTLLDATAYANLAWLVVVAVLAWGGWWSMRARGVLLALAVVTSRLMLGPVVVATMMIVGEDGMQVILAPVLLGAMAVAMVLFALLGAFLAWLAGLPAARLPGRLARRVPPQRVLAVLALVLAAAQALFGVFASQPPPG